MLLSALHLSKYNNIKCILEDVSFTIEDHDKIALIGINGTGKSTLLNILAGLETFQGTINKKKDLKISYLPQNPHFNEEYSVIKQAYSYLDQTIPEYEVKAMLNKLGINNYHQQIKQLSGGQQKRLALAITLLIPCDLLILDEPTNHLDNQMIEYLEKYLSKWNKGLFMVTHDRYFLERITHKILELDRCKIYTYEANYSTFLTQKQEREDIAIATQKKRKNFLKKELEWVRAGVQARSTKSKDRLQRFEALSQIEDIETIQNIDMINVTSRLGKKTIELQELSMKYDDHYLFKNFSYQFQHHEHVGILGQNGCGKSTLLNIISQNIQPTTGKVIMGETVKIGYFKQGHGDMNPQLRVIDYIKETAQILQTSEGSLSAKAMCEKFLFNSDLQYTTIDRLSGGEKRRLYLLKVLMEGPNVLLLDEPTNDLDITTLQILEDYLDTFSGIVITVSHDRYFLDRICDRLFIFNNQTIQIINGGYSQYLTLETNHKTKTNKEKEYRQNKTKKIKLSYKEKQELEQLEQQIPLLEQKIKEFEEQMNHLTDFKQLQTITIQRDECMYTLEKSSERWMELLEKE